MIKVELHEGEGRSWKPNESGRFIRCSSLPVRKKVWWKDELLKIGSLPFVLAGLLVGIDYTNNLLDDFFFNKDGWK